MTSGLSPSSNPPAQAGGSASLPLFYQSPVVLRFEQHKTKALAPLHDYRFARRTNAIPLSIGEFMPAIRHYPIVFAEGALPLPVALVGIRQGHNLHVDAAGAWKDGAYLPAYVRRYPFILTEVADKSARALCIDTAAGRFVDLADDEASSPLFNEDGTASPLAEQMLRLSEAWHQHQLQGADFIRALQVADLLVSKHANVEFVDRTKYKLQGFQIVDPERFRALPAETLRSWNDKGWLHAIALHLASLQNWSLLLELDRQNSEGGSA